MADYDDDDDRGAYTPSGDAPLSFDARNSGSRGAGRPPTTLIISAIILVVLMVAMFFLYRQGLRKEGEPPVVGAPLGSLTQAPSASSQPPSDASAGLEIYKSEEAPTTTPAPTFAPEPEPEPTPVAFAEEDDVLELTDKVREPEETHGDIDVFTRDEPRPAPAAWRAPVEDDPLIADSAADSAGAAFGHLARTVSMPVDGKSLEDVVRELLRPLLKSWLDEHLPEIVQARVDAEVARIARTRGR